MLMCRRRLSLHRLVHARAEAWYTFQYTGWRATELCHKSSGKEGAKSFESNPLFQRS